MKMDEYLNKIIHGDCLGIMKQMPDNCIDLVLTDPPYGIGVDVTMNKQGGKQYGNAAAPKRFYEATNWDDSIPSKEIFDEIFRVSKNQIIFGGNYFAEYLKNSPCWIVWDKNNGDNNFADCELAWTSFKSAVRKFKYTWNGMIQENMADKEYRHHPTQKPLQLMEFCISKYSEEGQTILDPFAGSCTTAIAAENLKRKWICIEREEKYFKIGQERIASMTAPLF